MEKISELQRFKNNIQAINQILNSNTSSLDHSILEKLYTGAGNFPYFTFRVPEIISGVFDNKANKPYLSEIRNLIFSLRENGYSDDKIQGIFSKIARSTLYAYFTDKTIVDAIATNILNSNLEKINTLTINSEPFKILDPSAGTGVFAKSFAEAFENLQNSGLISDESILQIDSIEPEPISFAVLSSLKRSFANPSIQLNAYQGKFENFALSEDRKYDVISSNIPFGKFKVQDLLLQKNLELSDDPLIHSYFFLKSSLFLKEQGQIGFITTSNFLDSPKLENDRAALFKTCELEKIIRLPKETFPGTEVQTDYLLVKRNDQINLEKQIQLISSVKLDQFQLNLSSEANPNKNKSDLYNINQFVLQNKNSILIGDWETNFMHGSYTLSSSFKGTRDLISAQFSRKLSKQSLVFDTSLSNGTVPTVDVKDLTISSEGLSKPVQKAVQLSLFDFDSFEEVETVSNVESKKDEEFIDFHLNVTSVAQKIEATTEENKVQLLKRELEENNIFHYSGAHIVYQDRTYILSETEKDYYLAQSLDFSIQGKELISVKNDFCLLQNALRTNLNVSEIKDLQTKLKSGYDDYFEKYGNITKDVTLISGDYYATEFLGLEYKNAQGEYVSSDIISDLNFFHAKKNIETTEQALVACLQTFNGNVNIEYISELLNKQTKEEKIDLAKELIKKELIFNDYSINIENNKVQYKFSTKEEFLSGNIPEKIDILSQVLQREKQFDYMSEEQLRNDLGKLQLEDISVKHFEELYININAEFLDPIYLETFLKNKFDYPGNDFFKFTEHRGFVISSKAFQNSYPLREFSVSGKNKTISGYSVLSDIINDKSFQYTYTVKDGEREITYKDVAAIKEAQLKSKQLKSEWKAYLFSLAPDEQEKILQSYNKTFCSDVPKKFNGDYLDFTDIQEIKSIHKHQSDSCSMVLQKDGGIIDHKVGAGKSIVMFASCNKLKQSGLKKKPMITCLLPTAEQLYKEYKIHYPDSKILLANPDKSSKLSPEEQRQAMYSRIANNDWDCVIMSHEELQKLPVPLSIQIDFVEERLEDLRDNLYFSKMLSEEGIKKQDLKRLENKIQTEEQKLENLFEKQNQNKTKSSYTFADLGIDHIFVDESHIFKKMPFTTIHHGIAGLDTKPSERAIHLAMMVRTLREELKLEDKGLTILSGTHINNSMAEIFHIFNLIAPKKLKRMGINTFDRFAKTFFQKESQSEISIGGKLKEKERFRYIVNVPELKSLYMSLAHVVNDSNFTVKTPNVENIYQIIEPNFQQEQFNEILVGFIEGESDALDQFAQITSKSYTEDQQQAASLIVSNYSLKNGIDPRLINENYFAEPAAGKLHTCADNIIKHYRETDKDKGVQLVFCDTGINNANGDFTVYKELKNILVEKHNIPAEEIQFANDWKGTAGTKKDKELREEFGKKTNGGEFRVVMGSTATLGTGRNVQRKVIALHDLDIPWRPSDSEQRLGRAKRQGNEIAELYGDKIFNYKYLAKKSLDVFRSQANEMKDKFLSIFKRVGVDTPRILDEGEIDGDGGSTNFSLMKAFILDNPEMMQISKLEKKMESLLQNKESILIQHGKTKRNLTYHNNELIEDIKLKDKYKVIHDNASSLFRTDDPEEIVKAFPFKDTLIYDVDAKIYQNVPADVKKIGDYLRARYDHILEDVNSKNLDFKTDPNFKSKINQDRVSYVTPLLKQGDFEAVMEITLDSSHRNVRDMNIGIRTGTDNNSLTFVRRSSVIPKEPQEAVLLIGKEILHRTSPESLFYLERRINQNRKKVEFLTAQLSTYDLAQITTIDTEIGKIKSELINLNEKVNKDMAEKKAPKKVMPKL